MSKSLQTSDFPRKPRQTEIIIEVPEEDKETGEKKILNRTFTHKGI